MEGGRPVDPNRKTNSGPKPDETNPTMSGAVPTSRHQSIDADQLLTGFWVFRQRSKGRNRNAKSDSGAVSLMHTQHTKSKLAPCFRWKNSCAVKCRAPPPPPNKYFYSTASVGKFVPICELPTRSPQGASSLSTSSLRARCSGTSGSRFRPPRQRDTTIDEQGDKQMGNPLILPLALPFVVPLVVPLLIPRVLPLVKLLVVPLTIPLVIPLVIPPAKPVVVT